MSNNLKKLRNARGLTQDELAAMMGTTRNQFIKLENGGRRMSDKWVMRSARALGVDPGEIFTEAGTDIHLRGLVGAGGLIEDDVSQVHRDGTIKVRLSISLPKGLSAFEVWGDSMRPKYEPGDVIIVEDEPVEPEAALGMICLVFTDDGRRYVKQILRGSEQGTFKLVSFNASDLDNVIVDKVGMIYLNVPHNQVLHLNESESLAKKKPRSTKRIKVVAAE